MRKNLNRLAAVLTAAAAAMGMAGGAGLQAVSADETAAAETETFDPVAFAEEHKDNPITISLYSNSANLASGTVSGYLGDYFRESKGLEINVWAYSEEKTNAILASGDLPDIMLVNAEDLSVMIDSGMVLDLDPYLENLPHVKYDIEEHDLMPALNFIRQFRSNGTGKLYCTPTGVGGTIINGDPDRNQVKLNWVIYEEIGTPEINSYDDLIDVAKQMMEAHPTDDNGQKIYGTVLNSGSDDQYWGNIITWMRWHGYTENQLPYLLETDMINGTYSSILEDNSMYYQGLKFYFDCMQAGILDPDSINTDRQSAGKKTRMFGGGTQPGWAPQYHAYWIPGTIYYMNTNTLYGDSVFGNTDAYYVVNANTENLDACLAFLDMMADPDAQLLGNAGPEGDMYEINDGVLTLTEKAKEYYKSNTGDHYYYEDGEQAYLWSTAWMVSGAVEMTYVGPNGEKLSSVHTAWPEELAITSQNDIQKMWSETTGYDSWEELAADKQCEVNSSPLDYINSFLSMPDDLMKLTMSAIKSKVVDASWKMVYAADEEEFQSLWDQMVKDCNELGADDLMQWRLEDIENAKELRDSVLGTEESSEESTEE